MCQLLFYVLFIISLKLDAVIVHNNSHYTIFAIEDGKHYISMLDDRYHILPLQQMHIPEDRHITLMVNIYNNVATFLLIREFYANQENNNNATSTTENKVYITDDLILDKYLKHSVWKRSY